MIDVHIQRGVAFRKENGDFEVIAVDGTHYLLDTKSSWGVCTMQDDVLTLRLPVFSSEIKLPDLSPFWPIVFLAKGLHVELWSYESLFDGEAELEGE